MRIKHIVTGLCVMLLSSLSLSLVTAQEAVNTPSQPEADTTLSVTVYNQGTALIKDRRFFTLNSGVNQVNFTDVAATIDATSVNFKSLTDPENTFVMEQNYAYDLVDASALLSRYIDSEIRVTMRDGTEYSGTLLSGSRGEIILREANGEVVVLRGEETRDIRFSELPGGLITRPTLRWLVQSQTGGEQEVELTYLAGGISWTADYNLLLNTDNTALDLNGWVTLNNNSGTSYDNAQLKLVAGDVNRVRPQMLMGARMDDGLAYEMAVPSAAPSVEQREFFEYKLYEVTRPVTIGNNETKQVEFVTGASIPAKTFYVYDASQPFYGYYNVIRDQFYGDTGITTVNNYLEFSTDEENGVNAALPAGRVRVYQEDTDGSALLIGENTIDHTPKGEALEIYLGNAFDLVGERVQTNFVLVSGNVIQETYEIRLRNQKENTPVEIRVPERLARWSQWEIIESSVPFEKVNASSIEFRVEVPPKGETVITYRVQYTFPN